MKKISPALLGLGCLLAAPLGAGRAEAAAIADVRNSLVGIQFWGACVTADAAGCTGLSGPESAGLRLSVASVETRSHELTAGDGRVTRSTDISAGQLGASARVDASAIVETLGAARIDLTVDVTLTLSNDGPLDYERVHFMIYYGPLDVWGGTGVAARVDDVSREMALFSSYITFPSRFRSGHQCSTDGSIPPTSQIFRPSSLPAAGAACGVASPDFSTDFLAILDLGAGETRSIAFGFEITAEARTIPEPATLGLFGAALAGLGATAGGLRRRRALTAEARAS